MSDWARDYEIGAIRKLLPAAWNPDDVPRFCMDHRAFRPACNEFGPGQGKDGMVDRLQRLIVETRVQPERLRLEVTEQVVSDHGDAAVARLRAVRSLGVRLSLDDFGTGYSSLRQLPELLCDAVKIDGSFLDGLTESGDGSRLVETVLALAGGLGLNVVAEGVETAVQGEALLRLGCPQGQGYWFARPLDPVAAEELLTRPPGWWKSGD